MMTINYSVTMLLKSERNGVSINQLEFITPKVIFAQILFSLAITISINMYLGAGNKGSTAVMSTFSNN